MTREVLLQAIKKKRLVIHSCGFCKYECSFYYKDEQLGYDSGCECTYFRGGWTPRDESEVDFYLQSQSWDKTLKEFVESTNDNSKG